jgi:putative thioredoxin
MAKFPNPFARSAAPTPAQMPAPAAAPRASAPAPIPSDMIGGGAQDLIKDATTASFVKDVIEASKTVPVLVDFWAPWCGPCKTLSPIIERQVRAAKGKVKLVKMDIDAHPSIAGQLGVQSIPAVFAFVDGRPIDGFMGALPENQVKAFIDRLIATNGAPDDGLEGALESAQAAFDEGDVKSAAEIFAAVLEEDKENIDALAGLAKCYVASGDFDHAESTLALVPPAKQSHEKIVGVRAMLDLARKAPSAAATSALEAAVASNPNDHQSRFDLALAMNAAGNKEGAVDHLLEIFKRNRAWNEEAARKQLVQFFEAWGPKDEMTLTGRRRLSVMLFA